MNRRDFLKRLGGAAAALTLSPLLDLAPIEPVVEAVCYEQYEFVIYVMYNLMTDNPRRLGVLTAIS